MSYLWLLLKFVLTSDTCKCDKYGEKKTEKSGRGQNWQVVQDGLPLALRQKSID